MPQETKRILIADDDPGIRSMLEEVLTAWGHEVEVAEDGFEALAKVELDIDLLMTDAAMPGMDGFGVVKRLRSDDRYHDLPIVMITGSTERQDRIRAAEAGVNDFITKPIDFTELQLRTTSLLRMKEMYDSLKHNKSLLEQTIARRTESLRRTLDELVGQQRQLRDANIEAIHRLVTATEYRDRGTGAHIRRMSGLSAKLARRMKLSPTDVELLHNASPMHDIGKITIPEEILLKPASLSEQEWGVMRLHTTVGGDILKESSIPLLRMGETIALSHHERWDGTGYPHKLKGESIPLEGRICAVADVFDALTHARPYKPAYSVENSLKMIVDSAGSHLDPTVVDALLAVAKEEPAALTD